MDYGMIKFLLKKFSCVVWSKNHGVKRHEIRVYKLVEQYLPKIQVYLELQTMTLFGNEVLADVIKVRTEMRSYWIRVVPKSNEKLVIRDRKGQREQGDIKMKAEIGVRHLHDK